jgi:chaperonin GroES
MEVLKRHFGKAASIAKHETLSRANEALDWSSRKIAPAFLAKLPVCSNCGRYRGLLDWAWSITFAYQTTCRGESMAKAKSTQLQYIEPIGPRVLVLKDEPKRETKGGIALPDASEIPTITGRIVTISRVVAHDEDLPLRQYDKILFHPKNAIPVDFEADNQLYVVPVEDIVAVFRKDKPEE